MNKNEFYYKLPEELIAQEPLEDRTLSRLMVIDKNKKAIEHRSFKDILAFLNKGDVIVLNDTRVLPARLYGNRPGKKESIEVLLLNQKSKDIWECLVRPGKKMKVNTLIEFGGGILKGKVINIIEDGIREIRFEYFGIFEDILDQLGEMPLPPYINHTLKDKERYQTVYSKVLGSAAAPTAGLHFDRELLNQLEDKGVVVAYITLHVGLGTFRPVKEELIEDHMMHTEYYSINRENAEKINIAKSNGNLVLPIGTTCLRALESAASDDGYINDVSGWTDIFIYPGYKFKACTALVTNFHLPESTLLMLVSALAGKDLILQAYQEAIKERYRFFSFGDATIIL